MLEMAPGGELYGLLQSRRSFSEARSAWYIRQVAEAMLYLHKKGIIHRDIKPENILLGMNDTLKIADFGWAIHAPSSRRGTFCGTLDYLSPEIVQNMGYTNKVDVWMLGILLFEFLTGSPPFEDQTQNGTFKRILESNPQFPDTVKQGARDLICKMLEKNADERLTLEGVLRHPWIADNTGGRNAKVLQEHYGGMPEK